MFRLGAMTPTSWVRAGTITEIVGELSSGRTSLMLACLRDVTVARGTAALVDADAAFDPESAARAGVVLSRLLWVRCGGRRAAALAATDLLARCPGFALVVLDAGETPPRVSLGAAFRLRQAARRARVAGLLPGRRRVTGAGGAPATRVVEANAAARERGIRACMPEAEAVARCPELIRRATSPACVEAARRALLDACYGVSPRIEDVASGLVHVDVTGLGQLVGDEAAIVERLSRAARA